MIWVTNSLFFDEYNVPDWNPLVEVSNQDIGGIYKFNAILVIQAGKKHTMVDIETTLTPEHLT